MGFSSPAFGLRVGVFGLLDVGVVFGRRARGVRLRGSAAGAASELDPPCASPFAPALAAGASLAAAFDGAFLARLAGALRLAGGRPSR
jgi:hypothetical protein